MPTAFPTVLHRDGGSEPISRCEILSAVKQGAVVRIPAVLRELGILDAVTETILAAVQAVAGSGPADQVRRVGLERIHDVLDGEQIETTLHQAHAQLGPRYPSFTKAAGQHGLGLTRPFYVHRSPMLRFMTPYDVAARNVERFTRNDNLGRLHPHAPHQDHWFGVPINALNVWMAFSAVSADNGTCVFPDAWTAELPKEGTHVRRNQYLGVPLRVACDAGDLVVFHNRHVHGSVLNLSQSTRCAITARLCVERPVAQTVNVLDGGCLYSPLIGTRFEPYAPAATRLSPIYLVERAKERIAAGVTAVESRLGWAPFRVAGRLVRRALRYRGGDLPLHIPPPIEHSLVTRAPAEIGEGEIAPIDEDKCAARINGRVHIFGRLCPHEGGDFAAGYLRDGRVHCPRHDYWIDPVTGRGPCSSMRSVPIFPSPTGSDETVPMQNYAELKI